jgi:hypothetical protein
MLTPAPGFIRFTGLGVFFVPATPPISSPQGSAEMTAGLPSTRCQHCGRPRLREVLDTARPTMR